VRAALLALALAILMTAATSAAVRAPAWSVPPELFHDIAVIPVTASPPEPILEPPRATPGRPKLPPAPTPHLVVEAKPQPVSGGRWHHDPEVSWYGPGFYGKRTACGLAYTKTILGVANRSLPCGTLVTFRNPANGRVATVPVIDRGPYVAGRQWDLSGALCVLLDHCHTGPIDWR